MQLNDTFAFSHKPYAALPIAASFFYCSDVSAERSRCQSRHRKLQGFARRRNEFDFGADVFFHTPPFVFLYVCSAGFWVLISGEVIVAGGRGWRAGAVNALQTG